MNKTDKIIAASAIAGLDVVVGEKETMTESAVTTILIYDKPCLILDRAKEEITICHNTKCSRKSSRLMNSVLELIAGARVENHHGRWFIKRTETSKLEQFFDDIVITTKKGMLIK